MNKYKLFPHTCQGCEKKKPVYSLDDGETTNPDMGKRCKSCAIKEWGVILGKEVDGPEARQEGY